MTCPPSPSGSSSWRAARPSPGTTPSATAALAPPWVIQFHDLLKTIGAKAVELATLNRICLTYDHEGSQAWAHIAVLHKLVNIQQRDAHEFQQNNLAKLADLFVTLDDQTRDMLYVKGAETVAPDAYNRRKKLANELQALMRMDRPSTRDGELSRQDLEANLKKFPRERINHDELLITMKDTILTRAFIAIAASPLAAYAEDTADKVIAEFRQARVESNAAKEGGSAAGGAVASVVSTSVGNLAGPSSLVVAFVWIRSFHRVAEAAKAAGDATKTASLAPRLLEDIAAGVLWDREKIEAFKQAAATADAALTAKMASSIAEVERNKGVISKAVSDNFMVGKGWNIGIALVNMYGLYNTITTYDPNIPRKVVNVFGGVVMSGLSVIQTLSSFAPGGTVAVLLKTVGNKCSIVAILASMVSGIVTSSTEDGNAQTAGQLQVVSGAASLGGFALVTAGFTPAGLALVVAGGLLMVASVGYSNMDTAKRHLGPGAKVVIREQLGLFLKFSMVQQVDRKTAALKPVVDAILALIEPDDASGLHDFDDSKSTILDDLRALPFAGSDIDLMTCSSYLGRPMLPPGYLR